jgi:hypothetical protein
VFLFTGIGKYARNAVNSSKNSRRLETISRSIRKYVFNTLKFGIAASNARVPNETRVETTIAATRHFWAKVAMPVRFFSERW